MQAFSASPKEMIASAWRHRQLIWVLTKREIIGRYRGSMLGMLWSLFNPIFMLAVYTFVFGVIFQSRWSDQGQSKAEFALVLFAGLIVFNLFAECTLRAPNLILGNVSYVKKVVFPLEILPWVNVGSALFHAAISTFVWIAFYTVEIGLPRNTALFFPFALLPLAFFCAGLGWLFGSLGVYLRDVGQIVSILTTVTMFLSPIFFPPSAVPLVYRPLLNLNPLSPAISLMRDLLYWGHDGDYMLYCGYLFLCVVFSYLMFVWFQKTRKGFADVL